MFGSRILEVLIGIIFVYFSLSLICSTLNELLSRIFSMRAKSLEGGIRNLLEDRKEEGLADDFFRHPLIKGLGKKGEKPSYIPARTFTLALMDIIAPAESPEGSRSLMEVKDAVAKITNEKVRKPLLLFTEAAEGSVREVQARIENWFDDAMDRVSGWYKKKTQMIILLLSFVLTVAFNADTFMIADTLYRDDVVRAVVVAAAEEAAKKPFEEASELSRSKVEQLQEEINQLPLPLGWIQASGVPRQVPGNPWTWVAKILGLLFTTLAVSLGAPFWFDVLNKVVNIRSAGKKPERASS